MTSQSFDSSERVLPDPCLSPPHRPASPQTRTQLLSIRCDCRLTLIFRNNEDQQCLMSPPGFLFLKGSHDITLWDPFTRSTTISEDFLWASIIPGSENKAGIPEGKHSLNKYVFGNFLFKKVP